MKHFLLTKTTSRRTAVIPSVIVGNGEQVCVPANPRAWRQYSIQQLLQLGLTLDCGIGTRK